MPPTTRWALLAALPLVAVAIAAAVLLTRPQEAGAVRAPEIVLRNADGTPFRLSSLRGRTVLVTFVDPNCTTFCPRASHVIDDALRTVAANDRPQVVAVSVDPAVREPAVLRRQARRFRWLPQWRWAVGDKAALAKTWRAYHIAVVPADDDIAHTEALYVLDAEGYERALLLWPFTKREVASAIAAQQSR